MRALNEARHPVKDYRAVGEGGDFGPVAALLEAPRDRALCMEADIKVGGRVRVTQCGDVGEVGVAPTEFAGAMTGGQRDGFVKEEELGVIAGAHDLAVPILVLQDADDPGLVPPAGAAKVSVVVVEDAAISHKEAASGGGDDVAGGEDTVLKRHWPRSYANRDPD